MAAHLEGAGDDVLEDLVQRVADMDIAIGIGRTVMQDIERTAVGVLTQLLDRGSCPASAATNSGSLAGRPARIGKSVCGRYRVFE